MMLTYILSIAIDLNDNLEVLKYLTPFKYFEAKEVMFGDGLDVVFILLSVGLSAILIFVTYTFFKKRDLNA